MFISSRRKRILFISVLIFFIGSQAKGGNMAQTSLQLSEQELKNVADKKIFFGHQSVGFNIIEGLHDITQSFKGIKLNIVKTKDQTAIKQPVFAHFTIGENDDPLSKVSDFARYMRSGIGNNVDVAFFKFCYIDIHRSSDVERIFTTYRDAMRALKKEFPETTFIHVTVPLTVYEASLKTFIKKVLGKRDNNINRFKYNSMLLKEYGGKEPVFDLAKIESTRPDGKRVVFNEGGSEYFSLSPEYTDDGGHLNEKGRRFVAQELLKFLASVK